MSGVYAVHAAATARYGVTCCHDKLFAQKYKHALIPARISAMQD